MVTVLTPADRIQVFASIIPGFVSRHLTPQIRASKCHGISINLVLAHGTICICDIPKLWCFHYWIYHWILEPELLYEPVFIHLVTHRATWVTFIFSLYKIHNTKYCFFPFFIYTVFILDIVYSILKNCWDILLNFFIFFYLVVFIRLSVSLFLSCQFPRHYGHSVLVWKLVWPYDHRSVFIALSSIIEVLITLKVNNIDAKKILR